ncbi:Uncharacterized protein DAT39_021409 [Clarias magur]|uniref:Uncharacterized protein n=1 Tax=Clarias magur TaxID=1594786 RepID=A0A8J4U176_CLAMG|nr:Uncharacterized protein DAT39_021409 [Clarias magur]
MSEDSDPWPSRAPRVLAGWTGTAQCVGSRPCLAPLRESISRAVRSLTHADRGGQREAEGAAPTGSPTETCGYFFFWRGLGERENANECRQLVPSWWRGVMEGLEASLISPSSCLLLSDRNPPGRRWGGCSNSGTRWSERPGRLIKLIAKARSSEGLDPDVFTVANSTAELQLRSS